MQIVKVDIFNTDKKYNIIYADPPWQFKTYSEKGKENKSAENHYPCMKKQDIQTLPINRLSDKDCILFLWVTFPCLQEGLELIKAWGFAYKTCGFTWVKRNKKTDSWFWGLGYWTRANAELCLIATKGKPKRVSKSVHQVCDARIREHSRKPCKVGDKVYKISRNKVKECEVVFVGISADEKYSYFNFVENYTDGTFCRSYSMVFNVIGKTVFLTREEAEAKLKEMKG